jgi:hypothetical protein
MWQHASLVIGRKLLWIVPVVLVVGLVCWRLDSVNRFLSTNGAKDTAEIVKNYAQALVWLAGGLFFAYKTFSGQNIVGMSLAVTATRSPAPQSADDYLAITLTLTGGERGTIRLHDAQARLFPQEGNEQPAKFDLKRLDHIWEKISVRGIVSWDTTNPREGLLNLAPKESTQFTSYCRVRAERACRIDVAVLGMRRSGLQMGQWRASCFSPPRVMPAPPEVPAAGEVGVSLAATRLWQHLRSLIRRASAAMASPAQSEYPGKGTTLASGFSSAPGRSQLVGARFCARRHGNRDRPAPSPMKVLPLEAIYGSVLTEPLPIMGAPA